MNGSSGGPRLLLAVAAIALAIPVVVVASGQVVKVYANSSGAMEPTLPSGAKIVMRVSKHFKRGDIVVFRFPADRKMTFAKRVIAVGGDLVQIQEKRLFVNGIELLEPYKRHEDSQVYPDNPSLPEPYRSRDHFGPFPVGSGQVFVLGDNRDRSFDSRYRGTVPNGDVLGTVILVVSLRKGVWRPG
jgi:signal peptidase I